ncbi:MAG TPA: hypothetical protein VJ599_08620 [Nitrososphaeraceae archaeon]|nr:hypothetical protein [Nitrososphaeraceae archaeon]
MHLRIYTVNQKYVKNKHGDIGVYKKKIKKWIKSSKPYKRQKRGLEKLSIYSTRFGFLDLYNRKEQQALICPSGYSISQCFNVMRKLWWAYHKSWNENNLKRIEKYAKAIQNVQKDMGIKTTSFPHLGIYGNQFILNNKDGERVVFEDHSALKKKQEEYNIWAAENAKKVQQAVLRPDIEKGEKIKTMPDLSYRIKRRVPKKDLIPNALIPDEEEGEELITMSDEIPFIGYDSPKKPKQPENGYDLFSD